MKKKPLFFGFLLVIILSTHAFAARSQTSTITNFVVTSSALTYSFDIYSQSTGSTSLQVGICSFWFDVDQMAFDFTAAPILSNINSKYSGEMYIDDYDPMTVAWMTVGSQKKVGVTINFTGNNTGIGSRLSSVGELICTVTLKIADITRTANLSWDYVNSSMLAFVPTYIVTQTFSGSGGVPLSAEFASFTASVHNLCTELQWSTTTEVNNYGFEVERRAVSDQPSAVSSWSKVGFVQGSGTNSSHHVYTYLDQGVTAGRYAYRIKQIDNEGAFRYSQSQEVKVGVAGKGYVFCSHYSNPFKSSRNIGSSQLLVKVKVFLQAMTQAWCFAEYIPLDSKVAYNESTFGYTAKTVSAIPNTNIVDWVLIELRTGTSATTKVETQAAFLLDNGTIVDVDGSSDLAFYTATAGDYYIVVWHRNHLAIMSAGAVALSNSSSLYDFTSAQTQASGTNSMAALGGSFGLIMGDVNADTKVNGADVAFILSPAYFNQSGYYNADVNFSGAVSAADVTAMLANLNKTSVVLPVELTSFTVSVNRLRTMLKWTTATEVNNYGFDIEIRDVSEQPSAVSRWAKVGFVNGNGTSNVQHSYTFSDNITESGTYAYRLKQIDNSGSFKYSQQTQVTIEIPKVFTLNQNYPNPFNPTTNIDFTVAADGKAVLKVYNTLGQEVAELYNGIAQAGKIIQTHFDASRLASGIYFSRLEADGKSLVKRMMFVK